MRLIILLMSATLLAPARAQTIAPVETQTIRVTGKKLEINGTREIPRGLFGVHATNLTAETIAKWGIEANRTISHAPNGQPAETTETPLLIECFYDRYQPARQLQDKNWQANLAALGRAYGENAKAQNRAHWVEFWNEPYLNWAANPGVNYDGGFYEPNPKTGAPMTLKDALQPTEFLVWDKPKLVAVDPENGNVDYLATRYLPAAIDAHAPKEGDEWMFRGKFRRRLEMRWWGRDISQNSHFSADQNSLYYRQMFVPFARALKEANPEVQIIAGWGRGRLRNRRRLCRDEME